jgi:sugar phosphate isomerase/epimerase
MKAHLFIILFSVIASLVHAQQPTFTPPLYAFQNGVHSMPVEKGAQLLKELGYQGIGSVYPNVLPAYKAASDKAGIKIFSIYAGGIVNADGYQIDNHVIDAINILKGTDTLIELNVRKGKNPNDEQAIALVSEIADKAKAAGLKVVIYPHANFHIERLDHAVRIAEAVKATGRDNVGVTFNLCHFLKVQPSDDLSAALLAAKPYLWSASICGADKDGKDWPTLIRPLDEGTYDQASLLKKLQEIGFNGTIGLQCYNIKIDPTQHLTRSQNAWKKLTSSQ